MGWQWIFPATRLYVDRVTGQRRRHHLHESAMREGLVAMFADCVSAVGPTRELPLVEGGSTAFEDLGVLIPLSDPGLVSDGYYHWLRVQHATGLIYIVQVGGIAGRRTLFGPFTAEAGCLASPRKESPPLLRESWRESHPDV
jgi:hypothetical protein